jgi:hypothetical protein
MRNTKENLYGYFVKFVRLFCCLQKTHFNVSLIGRFNVSVIKKSRPTELWKWLIMTLTTFHVPRHIFLYFSALLFGFLGGINFMREIEFIISKLEHVHCKKMTFSLKFTFNGKGSNVSGKVKCETWCIKPNPKLTSWEERVLAVFNLRTLVTFLIRHLSQYYAFL